MGRSAFYVLQHRFYGHWKYLCIANTVVDAVSSEIKRSDSAASIAVCSASDSKSLEPE